MSKDITLFTSAGMILFIMLLFTFKVNNVPSHGVCLLNCSTVVSCFINKVVLFLDLYTCTFFTYVSVMISLSSADNTSL